MFKINNLFVNMNFFPILFFAKSIIDQAY